MVVRGIDLKKNILPFVMNDGKELKKRVIEWMNKICMQSDV